MKILQISESVIHLGPSASVDNTLLDLQNSSYPTQPHSIIAKYPDYLNFNERDHIISRKFIAIVSVAPITPRLKLINYNIKVSFARGLILKKRNV